MKLQVGNVIQVNSNRVGAAVRKGTVIEVVADDTGEVRVAWEDGHESLLMPAGGMVRVVAQQAEESTA